MAPRHTIRTAYNADALFQDISEGKPLRQICRELKISYAAVYDWLDDDHDFATRIARARASGYDAIAQEALDIADDSVSDYVKTENGEAYNAEHVQRSKLRVDTRLKLLAKWDPKRYGERVQTDLNVSGELNVRKWLTESE